MDFPPLHVILRFAMLQLKRPDTELIPSYEAFMNAMAAQGEELWKALIRRPGETDGAMVDRFLRAETAPEPGLVPETFYWAVDGDGTVLGRISLRHELIPALREFGGHIGYEVHPAYRRQGVATSMLAELLKTPKARAIGKLLLTCDPQNIGSVKTIEKNGGRLEQTRYLERVKRDTSYYWIEVC